MLWAKVSKSWCHLVILIPKHQYGQASIIKHCVSGGGQNAVLVVVCVHDPDFEDENDTQIRGQKAVSPQWGDNFSDPNSGPTLVIRMRAQNVPKTERGDHGRADTWPSKKVVASTNDIGWASSRHVHNRLWRHP